MQEQDHSLGYLKGMTWWEQMCLFKKHDPVDENMLLGGCDRLCSVVVCLLTGDDG